ncbi:hypothetical protein DRQ36_02810 [bacterium]|nr:MAG: hypothetical protein DRQ36_02810 [bacterium]
MGLWRYRGCTQTERDLSFSGRSLYRFFGGFDARGKYRPSNSRFSEYKKRKNPYCGRCFTGCGRERSRLRPGTRYGIDTRPQITFRRYEEFREIPRAFRPES